MAKISVTAGNYSQSVDSVDSSRFPRIPPIPRIRNPTSSLLQEPVAVDTDRKDENDNRDNEGEVPGELVVRPEISRKFF